MDQLHLLIWLTERLGEADPSAWTMVGAVLAAVGGAFAYDLWTEKSNGSSAA